MYICPMISTNCLKHVETSTISWWNIHQQKNIPIWLPQTPGDTLVTESDSTCFPSSFFYVRATRNSQARPLSSQIAVISQQKKNVLARSRRIHKIFENMYRWCGIRYFRMSSPKVKSQSVEGIGKLKTSNTNVSCQCWFCCVYNYY